MLKLNVGFSREIGEANYGSRGASTNLELELDSGLVGDAAQLKERIRRLFILTKTAVNDESASSSTSTTGNGTEYVGQVGNGTATEPPARRHRDETRPATANQVRALDSIAERRQLDLPALLNERFQTLDAASLTIIEASALIDELTGSVMARRAADNRQRTPAQDGEDQAVE